MFSKKNNGEKIDMSLLNEVIKWVKNILKIVFILGIATLIAIFLYLMKEFGIGHILISILNIISPLFIGASLAWLLDPIVRWLERKKISRSLSTVIVFVFFVAFVIFIFYLFIPSFIHQLQDVVSVFPKLIDDADNWIKGFFSNLGDLYNFDFSDIQKEIYNFFSSFSETITIELPNKIVGFVTAILTGSITLLIGLIIGFYMLFDFNNVRRHLLIFVPRRYHSDAIELTDNLNRNLRNYVQGILLDTSILFVFQTVAFKVAGLEAPLVFGMICAITNIIPYIGPYIGGIPAVLVGLSISPRVGLFTFIAVFLSQILESYVLNPIIMSKSMKLHPVTIIIGLLLFGHYFGILGLILSTPIISCLKVVFNFFENKFGLFERIKN